MLSFTKLIAFVPTKDAKKARAFYVGILGLRFVSEDPFALVLDAKGIMVRVALVAEFQPQQFTIVGWEVSDLNKEVGNFPAHDRELRSEEHTSELQSQFH